MHKHLNVLNIQMMYQFEYTRPLTFNEVMRSFVFTLVIISMRFLTPTVLSVEPIGM